MNIIIEMQADEYGEILPVECEEIEDIIANALAKHKYHGSVECKNTSNSTQIRPIEWLNN